MDEEYKWWEEEDKQPESFEYQAGPSSPIEEKSNIEKYINRSKQKWAEGYKGLAEGNTWGYNTYYTKSLEKYESI